MSGDETPSVILSYSDGRSTGGLICLRRYGVHDREWPGPATSGGRESLIVHEPGGGCFRYFESYTPRIVPFLEVMSEDRRRELMRDSEAFRARVENTPVDAASRAVGMKTREAAAWLTRNGYEVPADIQRAVDSRCELSALTSAWVPRLRRLREYYPADQSPPFLLLSGWMLNASYFGALSEPEFSEAVRLLREGERDPVGEYAEACMALIAAVEGQGHAVDQSTPESLIKTLADGISRITDCPHPQANEAKNGNPSVGEIRRPEDQAVWLLMSEGKRPWTIRDIAAAVGVNEKTPYKWKRFMPAWYAWERREGPPSGWKSEDGTIEATD